MTNKKFFFPGARDLGTAKARLVAASRFTGLPIPFLKIYHIRFEHNSEVYEARVGEHLKPIGDTLGPVLCILGDPKGLGVCTVNHGSGDGEAIHFSEDQILAIEFFDQGQPQHLCGLLDPYEPQLLSLQNPQSPDTD